MRACLLIGAALSHLSAAVMRCRSVVFIVVNILAKLVLLTANLLPLLIS